MENNPIVEIQKLKQNILKQEYTINMLNAVINDLPGSIYWKDKNGVYLGCNSYGIMKLRQQLLQQDSIIGKTDYDLFPKDIADQYTNHDLEVINTGKEICLEEKMTTHDGKALIQLSYKKPLRDPKGAIIGIMGNTVDITHLKRIEKELREETKRAEAANKAKTAFLENMRHDIRTPLSGIVGVAELLKDERDSNKIEKYTNQIFESSNELLCFLNEILESINVATGEIPLLRKKFNLNTTLKKVIALHQAKADEKQLKLELQFDERIPKYLIGDPIRIYRVVLELLVNALKFTKEGYVKIFAELAKKNGRDLIIKIEVEDTGPGVPMEKQQELFVRFKKLTPSYPGIYKGAGLGLSIAKQFIDDLQAEIYYDIAKKKGAKFICLIPVREALLEDPTGEDSCSSINFASSSYLVKKDLEKVDVIEETNVTAGNKNNILIIEDQMISSTVFKDLFEKLGCKVDIAQDGKAAIKLVEERYYDLIFMDIGLPDMDGYEVTKHIRSCEQRSRLHTPIIGLTAHLDKEKQQLGAEVGMDAVLTKPLLRETAIDILKNFITKHSVEK